MPRDLYQILSQPEFSNALDNLDEETEAMVDSVLKSLTEDDKDDIVSSLMEKYLPNLPAVEEEE